jgi:hypothetical protein
MLRMWLIVHNIMYKIKSNQLKACEVKHRNTSAKYLEDISPKSTDTFRYVAVESTKHIPVSCSNYKHDSPCSRRQMQLWSQSDLSCSRHWTLAQCNVDWLGSFITDAMEKGG